MPQIELIFEKDGTVQKKTSGFKGKSCTEATKFIEEALGGEVTSRSYTAEYYQAEAQATQNKAIKA